MRRSTLGRRLIAVCAATFGLLLLAGPATYLLTSRAFQKELDRNLLFLADEFVAGWSQPGQRVMHKTTWVAPVTAPPQPLSSTRGLVHRPRHALIVDVSGKVLIGDGEDRPLAPGPVEQARRTLSPAFSDAEFPAERLRTVARPFEAADGRVLVAEVGGSHSVVERTLRTGILVVAGIGLAGVIVLAAGTILLWRRTVAPIGTVVAWMEAIREDDLAGRSPPELESEEVARLVMVTNRLLERIGQALESQRRFTSDVAHEVRSPLTVLRGEIEVALRKERTPEEYRGVLQDALEETQRLTRLVENLQSLASADAGVLAVVRTSLDLHPLLVQVVKRMRPVANEKDIRLVLHGTDGIVVHGDPDWLSRVVENLVENAIRHSERLAEVDIRLSRTGTHAVLEVEDAGCGIPPEHVLRIFERFHRVDPARSRDAGGAGLGLPIAEQIVLLHGGTIDVRSVVGKGSAFSVKLPLQSHPCPGGPQGDGKVS